MATPRYKDEVGNKYNSLTVKEFKGTNKNTSFWLCLCDCGKEKIVRGNSLRAGTTKTCGDCGFTGKTVNPLNPYKSMFRALDNGAKSRGFCNELSLQDIIELSKQNCFFCDSPPSTQRKSNIRKPHKRHLEDIVVANGVDRLDNDEGYTLSNSVPCCPMCNRMKSNFTLEDFMKKVEQIYEHREKISINSKNKTN